MKPTVSQHFHFFLFPKWCAVCNGYVAADHFHLDHASGDPLPDTRPKKVKRPPRAALTVYCPVCQARAGEPCVMKPNEQHGRVNHRERLKFALAQLR